MSYLPATRLGFVWDDVIITTLSAVREWGGIRDLWFAPVSAYRQGTVGEYHYWPLLYTAFWLQHKLWGFAPAGFHVASIALHFINTALLWRLLRRLRVAGAWWIAAVFAVHPLHVESVTWVIAQKDLLSTLFYLAAFSAWLSFVETPRLRRHLAALALFAAALLCKSSAVSLPAALLIRHWWKHGRVTGADLLRLLPMALVGLALIAVDMAVYSKVNLSFDYSPVQRALIAAHALWFYAGKLLWPVDLALFYPHWDVDTASPAAWGYLIAAVCLAAGLWLLRHRTGRGPLACLLFFAVTLSPVLGFVDYGYMNVSFAADRYQYLAGAGVLALAIGAAARGAVRLPDAPRKAAAGAGLAVLLLLGTATWKQSGVYQDDLTLFSHAAAVNPDSWAAHHYAGTESFERHRYEQAERHLRRSLALKPRDRFGRRPRNTLQNIAETLRRRGRLEEAVETYRAVAAKDPGYAMAHAGMADAMLRLRRYGAAVDAVERALALKPPARTVKGLRALRIQALDRAAARRFADRRYREALALYRRLAELHPDNADAHSNAGASLHHLGRLDAARRSFRRALSLNPHHENARAGLRQTRARLRQRGQ